MGFKLRSRSPSALRRTPPRTRRVIRWLILTVILLGLGLPWGTDPEPIASAQQAQAAVSSLGPFCQQPPEAVARKEQLRQRSLQSDAAWAEYTQLLSQHRAALEACRQTRWPQTQAIWLRLYTCDTTPGILDQIFDQIVNQGYNRVFIETFYDGQVLLPEGESDPWPSVQPDADLLDQAITAARRRGLGAYVWMFSLNYGYAYSQLPDRQQTLARNGSGNTSLLNPATATIEDISTLAIPDQVFVDPFHPQARQDYLRILTQALRRQPDGVLFDYIRYPRSAGAASVASTVKDLWIYGEAARASFIDLGRDPVSQATLSRYLDQGFPTADDLIRLDQTFSTSHYRWRQPGAPDPTPTPVPSPSPSPDPAISPTPTPTPTPTLSASRRLRTLQPQLWQLAVDFARFGIVDYLNTIAAPVQAQGIPAGAVFFPKGNARVGESGYDSRLQPWDRFDPALEWHPMAYAKCDELGCVGDQVQRVIAAADPQTFICPAIAGLWGQSLDQRPMLELQMQELGGRFPQLPCVSHFAFSWLHPASDQQRKSCAAP